MCCSPFYGQRRPRLQRGAKLLCVSDLLLLGRVTIDESRSLLHWLEVEAGFGKTGICGLSMGKMKYTKTTAFECHASYFLKDYASAETLNKPAACYVSIIYLSLL